MDFPWTCPLCGYETMIELDHLDTKNIGKVMFAEGYLCGQCRKWVVVSFMTISLREKMDKLIKYQPGHPKFPFLFGKVLKKAEGVHANGALLWQDQM